MQNALKTKPIGIDSAADFAADSAAVPVAHHAAAADPRWARVVARDTTADGEFWYSVATTKIYCKPSCPSRAANPRNVVIHDSLASAKATGYRACKRCKPDSADTQAQIAELVGRACRLIEEREQAPSLNELALAIGLSPGYFHRLFKRVVGLTPKEYAAEQRAKKVRAALLVAPRVTDAIYQAGFNSSGRFYEASTPMLGMTPTRYAAGGANETLYFALGESSLGTILVASSEKGVAAILMGDDPEVLLKDLQDRFPRAKLVGGDARYEALVAQVVGHAEAPGSPWQLPLDVRGTAFQRRVWLALQQIPAGSTQSYLDVAAAIGSPKAVRAVARACATNPLAIAIPCHRVVRQDGALSGYAWGVERKRFLLDRESGR